MKIYYVANARMPNEKAHGIQIAKMCEAFVEAGADLTLMIPDRGEAESLRDYYKLRAEVPMVRLPVLDLQFLGPVGYRLTALQFVCLSFLHVWIKCLAGEHFVVYTVDMDAFSFAPLTFLPCPVFAEMHNVKRSNVLTRRFFRRAGIIATNELIANELMRTFSIPPERLCIEPNGVDEAALGNGLSQQEARAKLGLPLDEPFALYVGRFYAWKGLDILAEAAALSPLPIRLVGGTREEYERVTRKSGETLLFAGAKPVSKIPTWLAAADVLLVLGTAHNADSYRHTAPMKIFEYLAACRVVVASRTPAMENVLQRNMVFWYEPDDARSFARAIREAYASPEAPRKVQSGHAFATMHTWQRRAERILTFMKKYVFKSENTKNI